MSKGKQAQQEKYTRSSEAPHWVERGGRNQEEGEVREE